MLVAGISGGRLVGMAVAVGLLAGSVACVGEEPDPAERRTPAPEAAVAQPDCEEIWQRGDGEQGFYEDNPVYEDPYDDSAEWEVATPASQGLDEDLVREGADRLARVGSLRSVIVVRHGRLVFERYYHEGGPTQSRNVHSASKGILQGLLGIAIERGDLGGLDDKVSDYLPAGYFDSAAKRDLTLRDMITMRSGLSWREDHTEYGIGRHRDWVRRILARPLVAEPGSEAAFTYSSGNTHVLSAVLQSATGMSTCEFAQRHLFGPLGISPEHWGRDPMEVFTGGFSLYLRPRELARFGQVYLDGGRWDGTQVVPEATVDQAARDRHSCSADGWCYSHGWWWKTIAGHDTFVAYGFGGQMIYLIPDLDLVFSQTQDTGTASPETDHEAYVADYLIPAVTD